MKSAQISWSYVQKSLQRRTLPVFEHASMGLSIIFTGASNDHFCLLDVKRSSTSKIYGVTRLDFFVFYRTEDKFYMMLTLFCCAIVALPLISCCKRCQE